MSFSLISPTDTFLSWVTRTNKLAMSVNNFTDLTVNSSESYTLLNTGAFNSNVTLNKTSGMYKGDAGLLSVAEPITNSKEVNTGIVMGSDSAKLTVSGGFLHGS